MGKGGLGMTYSQTATSNHTVAVVSGTNPNNGSIHYINTTKQPILNKGSSPASASSDEIGQVVLDRDVEAKIVEQNYKFLTNT